jgi:hypothetical protein
MRFLILLPLTLLFGCFPSVQLSRIHGNPETSKNYSVGDTLTASVGSPVITGRAAMAYEAYIAQIDYHPPQIMAWPRPRIVQGQKWIVKASTDSFQVVYPTTETAVSMNWYLRCGIRIKSDGSLYSKDSPWVDCPAPGEHPSTVWGDIPDVRLFAPAGKHYELGDFSYELIYGGVSGKTIKILYREYSGDFARPSFFQELQYDIGGDAVISFRDIDVRVLSASSSRITVVVLKD